MFKEKYPYNYPLPMEKKWAANFWSLLKTASELRAVQWTNFADPRQQQIARDLLGSFPDLQCSFFGGYPDAERVRICISPPSAHGVDEEKEMGCLIIKGGFPQGVLTHRDFLGALLGLGI